MAENNDKQIQEKKTAKRRKLHKQKFTEYIISATFRLRKLSDGFEPERPGTPFRLRFCRFATAYRAYNSFIFDGHIMLIFSSNTRFVAHG